MKLSDRKIVGAALSLLFVVSIVQSGAILRIFNVIGGGNQTAQVGGSIGTGTGNRQVVGPEQNGQSFSFKGNTTATITVCGAGGGGGGGFSFFSWGVDGGGGGGGGGKGQCQTIKRKFRTSDVLTWNIGNGGIGGIGGLTYQIQPVQLPVDVVPTAGQAGGATRLYVNGMLVAEAVGGNGGHPAGADFGDSYGGNGGSILYAVESWHKGGNGSVTSGGAGGKGETNTAFGGGAGGEAGTADLNHRFGGNGLVGYATFGGGGGGGSAPYFQVEQGPSKAGGVSRGGNGGNGGNGHIIITQ